LSQAGIVRTRQVKWNQVKDRLGQTSDVEQLTNLGGTGPQLDSDGLIPRLRPDHSPSGVWVWAIWSLSYPRTARAVQLDIGANPIQAIIPDCYTDVTITLSPIGVQPGTRRQQSQPSQTSHCGGQSQDRGGEPSRLGGRGPRYSGSYSRQAGPRSPGPFDSHIHILTLGRTYRFTHSLLLCSCLPQLLFVGPFPLQVPHIPIPQVPIHSTVDPTFGRSQFGCCCWRRR